MDRKKICLFFFLLLSLKCFAELNYPHFKDNPSLDVRMQSKIAPYLLPLDHPMKAKLDLIFSQSRVLENERTFVNAGFEVIAGPRVYSFVIVARHPEIPGYVFKLYLDSETRMRNDVPHWKWLVRRCEGAQSIRKVIKRKNILHFSVPDKWLYVLPAYPFSSVQNPEVIILMETDMELETKEVSRQMWKTGVTRKHLDELYSIFKHGYGGPGIVKLPANVPYTKNGTFAFTDTEDPPANLKLKYIKKYLSKEMQRYWDTLLYQ